MTFYFILIILGKGGRYSISIVRNVFPPWSQWIPNELLMCFSSSQGVLYNIYASSHTIFLGGEDKRVLDFLDFCCSQCVCYMFPMNFQHVFQVDNSNSFLSHIICWKAHSCNLYRRGKREDIDYNYILRVKKHCLGYHSSLGFFSSWANQQGPLQIK